MTHSPSSVEISATTPSNGARRTVFPTATRATSSEARAWPTRARAASQAAAVIPASVCAFSRRPTERTSSFARLSLLARSRRAWSAARHASRSDASATTSDFSARASWARTSSAAIRTRTSPFLHPVALADGEALDAAADLRAQRGAPARLHRPGPAPGDGLLDRPARGRDDRDRDGIGPEERDAEEESDEDDGQEDETPAKPRACHRDAIVGAWRRRWEAPRACPATGD